jgi:hypothetical protein
MIYEYTLAQAVADGQLVEIFKERWSKLTGGKPLVATMNIMAEFTLVSLQEIWNEYEKWRQTTDPKRQREEIFTTQLNDHKVWVMEDQQAFTILFPEDY